MLLRESLTNIKLDAAFTEHCANPRNMSPKGGQTVVTSCAQQCSMLLRGMLRLFNGGLHRMDEYKRNLGRETTC